MANEIVKTNKSVGFFDTYVPEYVLFNGTRVEFPPSLYYFMAAKAAFVPEIKRVYQKAVAGFDENVGTMEKFVQNAENWFPSVVSELCEFAIRKLAEYGSFELDDADFFQKYVSDDFQRIQEIHSEMSNEYYEIRRRQEQRNAERKAERDAKGRWERRNLFDMAGDWMTDKLAEGVESIGNSIKADGYFTDDKKQELQQELLYICYSILIDFTLALYDTTGKDSRCPITVDTQNKAEKLFAKLSQGLIPESHVPSVALDVFKANPMIEGLLPWCVVKFGDKDGEFQKTAALFHVESDVVETKEGLLNKVIKVDTEKNARASLEELKRMEGELHYHSTVKEKMIEESLNQFEQQRKEAEKKKQEEAERLKKQKQETIDRIEKKYSFTNEVCTQISECMSLVQNTKMKYLYYRDPLDPLDEDNARRDYDLPNDDLLFGEIKTDFCCIGLGSKGIYFKSINKLQKKYPLLIPFLVMSPIALLLFLALINGTGQEVEAIIPFSLLFYYIWFIFGVITLGKYQRIHPGLRDNSKLPSFIPWDELDITGSPKSKILFLNKDYKFNPPVAPFDAVKTAEFLCQIKQTIQK